MKLTAEQLEADRNILYGMLFKVLNVGERRDMTPEQYKAYVDGVAIDTMFALLNQPDKEQDV